MKRARFVTLNILLGCCLSFSFIFLSHAHASNVEVGVIIKSLFETKKVETGSSHLNDRMEELEAFYEARSFKPIWVRDDGPKGKAKALLTELNRSIVHGLEPSFYRVERLTGLMGATDPTELAELEMLFGGALIDYGYDLSNGHVGFKSDPGQVQIRPVIRSITEVMDGAEQAGDLRLFIGSLLNVDDRYVRLVSKISEMKRALDSGLWPKIAADIPELELGQSHPEIVNIRTYLMLMGDFLAAEFTEKVDFDRPLEQALMSFQSRQGIAVTGKLDNKTIAELATPVEQTIEKISINLERRRWQNRPIGETHLYINLADASARLVKNDEKAGEFAFAALGSDKLVPSLYGKVDRVAVPDSGAGLRLMIVPDAFHGDTKEVSIDLLGETQDLVKQLSPQQASLPAAKEEIIDLTNPVDVFITYVTAWANKDGSVHFRPDRFGRDAELVKILAAK